MAETVDMLQQKLADAEAAAREADVNAGNGVPGAALRAESRHREARFYIARIGRLEAGPVGKAHIKRLEAENGTRH